MLVFYESFCERADRSAMVIGANPNVRGGAKAPLEGPTYEKLQQARQQLRNQLDKRVAAAEAAVADLIMEAEQPPSSPPLQRQAQARATRNAEVAAVSH